VAAYAAGALSRIDGLTGEQLPGATKSKTSWEDLEMKTPIWSRRKLLEASGALAAATAFPATRVLSAAPPASAVTPLLIEAAKKEGKVVWYTSVDLPLAEKVAKAFEAKYPGVAVRVERTGAERVFQRVAQEYASNIHAADVANSSDAAHFIVWKGKNMLEPYLPEDVARFYPAEHKDPDGNFASFRVWVCIIAYNTNLVKKEDAPKSFADLLDPKWKGKLVKAHPSYSGTIMTATYQMQRELGWGYFEKLAQQNVMQVQSSADPPKRLALGERAVMADGNEYNIFQLSETGKPVAPIYATEGSPLIVGPTGMFKAAPNPNAAKLFCNYSYTPECQQLIIDTGGLRSMHPQTKEKPGRTPFKDIKTMKDDPAAVEKMSEEIKAHYSKLFKV
jgi:iron(III) transport system substrate-binding protein